MSSPDHDILHAVATDEQAILFSASSPRRDPVADADDTLTRKRPRLDNGADGLRAMSSEPHTPENPSTTSPEKPLEMTIRSHPPSSPLAASAHESSKEGTPSPEQTETARAQSPIIIVGSDEEAGSPPIELVQEEDDSDALAIQLDHVDHFHQFPYIRYGDYTQTVRDLAHHFATVADVDPNILSRLANWLNDTPSPTVDLEGFYTSKSAFWEEFGTCVSKLLSRRYAFNETYDDQATGNMARVFFLAYMRICSFLLLADLHTMSATLEQDPQATVLSYRHLKPMCILIRQSKSSLFHILNKEYGVDIPNLSKEMHWAFFKAKGAQNLLRFADEAFHRFPNLMQNNIALYVSQVLNSLGWFLCQLPNNYRIPSVFIDPAEYNRGILLFFQKYSGDLSDLGKPIDASIARDLISHFSVLLCDLCSWDASIAAELADTLLDFKDPESPATPSSAERPPRDHDIDYRRHAVTCPPLISNAWKFKLLRKFVIRGKMDMRVMSMVHMDAALIDIHRDYNKGEQGDRPALVQYLANFLLQGQVVNYIISVDSHPQIISRSGNIVGFLVVTGSWSDVEADAIWRTVATSPDPRVVTATMTMLRTLISLMKPEDQLYLCKKLYDLPIDRYTLDILRFLRELTRFILDHRHPSIDFSSKDPASRPWNVCIRILRDTAPSRDIDKNLYDLHAEVMDQFYGIIRCVGQDERMVIYRQCTQYVAARTKEATGSIKAIHMLAAQPLSMDALFFQDNKDLARQILEELIALVDSETELPHYPLQLQVLEYRLEFLGLLIQLAGGAIPESLYQTIWDHIIGKDAWSKDARNLAWAQLLKTVRMAPDNDFCKQLVQTYLPALDPRFYTEALFDFVAGYHFPATLRTVLVDGEETPVPEVPGADLLWSMVLFSPQGTIEDRAVRLLTSRYLQISTLQGVSVAEAELAHSALVEKCMKEIRNASNQLRLVDLPMTDSAQSGFHSQPGVSHEYHMRLARVLLFLRLMLEYIRHRPEFNRGRRTDSKIDEADVPAVDSISVKYQCGSDRRTILMAPDNTLEDLFQRLCIATGFTKINLFAKGQKLDVSARADERIETIDFGGQLLVQRAGGATVTNSAALPVTGSSVFETTVVKHFDELFAMMSSNDLASQLIFEFLCFLPPLSNFADGVVAENISTETLFPPGRFFQARYAAQALEQRLRDHIRSSTLNEKFLANAIRHLNEALLGPKLLGDSIARFQERQLAGVLVRVLLEFLRERPSPEMSATYFSEGSHLADRLVQILCITIENNDDFAMVQDVFAVIVEASLHSRAVWEAFVNNTEFTRLHHALLLTDMRQNIRESIARKIASVCGGELPSSCPLESSDITCQFWSVISSILPDAIRYPHHSKELFEIAEQVFQANDEHHREEEMLHSHLTQWSTLLLVHKHQEFVGRDQIDHVVLGFTKLLLRCILSIKSKKSSRKSLDAGHLMEQIFRKYLFVQDPQRAILATETVSAEGYHLPILESQTRQELYDLMLALAEDRNTYDVLVQLTTETESVGRFNSAMPYMSVDRSLEIRSSTGYVGLYNPRAICYMNSLLTQLFMNVNFRDFMLSLEVQEARGSQMLLHETQRLFTTMQHSFRRSADPREFAACVRNLDSTPIDIAVQMDADEFFNLLFDQWEAQLVKEEHKQRFRSFYGGQTLNQIKSKECEHVSERAEPFFAVQCDIQGKATLHESLQAFVRGDVMEGDNKYKCESCGGKFVDAVKRTCLKEVPDNLIFHLKRFEFDLNDFSRRKINDYFEFPPSIDISEYHVDYLSDPTLPRKQDVFDLVGVLVHTGTCENGHYYSYIRERPCATGFASPSWVEFDDSNVGLFDPADIAQRAFGGTFEDLYGARTMKNFSAYMLFYQRRSAIEIDQHRSMGSMDNGALKVPVPIHVRKEVEHYNHAFIREYCLFDPSHSKFVRNLHSQSRAVQDGNCSEDHEQEKNVFRILVSHMGQIVARHQTMDVFLDYLSHIRRQTTACTECCEIFLRTISTDDCALSYLLLRNVNGKVRAQTRLLLIDCLRRFREKEPVLYGIEVADSDMELEVNPGDTGVFADLTKRLNLLIRETPEANRGWDDLYLTLAEVARLGLFEAATLLTQGTLEFCLKLFLMHHHPPFARDLPDFVPIFEARRGIYNKLICLVCTLLSYTDLGLPTVQDKEDRLPTIDRERMKFPLANLEKQIITYWSDSLKALIVLDRILDLFDPKKTDEFYPSIIIGWIFESRQPEPCTGLTSGFMEGLSLDAPFCDGYIRGAVAFCQYCPIPRDVQRVVNLVVRLIANPRESEDDTAVDGETAVNFLIGLFGLQNEAMFEVKGRHIFYNYLLTKSLSYAIPLLVHDVETVRKRAQMLLCQIFSISEELPVETAAMKWKFMRKLLDEMFQHLSYEKDGGILRHHLTPLVQTCRSLVGHIQELIDDDDEESQQFKDHRDETLVSIFKVEVEERLNLWHPDDAADASEGGLDGASDYGSESDEDTLLE